VAPGQHEIDFKYAEASHREKRRLKISQLPANLSEALDELEKDQTVRDALGEHILDNYLCKIEA
jgi:glutamine synthetase